MSVAVESPSTNTLPSIENPSPSGFTAVNGRSPPQAAPVANAVNGDHSKEKVTEQPAEEAIVVARATGAVEQVQKDPTKDDPPQHNDVNMEAEEPRSSPGKRKRSSSIEGDDSASSSLSSQSPKRHIGDSSVLSEDGPDKAVDRSSQSYSAHSGPSEHGYPNHVNGDSTWTNSHDDRFRAALQRENQAMDTHQMVQANGDPEPRYPSLAAGVPYQEGVTPTTNLASAQKQRKRIFSNRTKTGCLTCRKRKKKCDERKPKCSNCERGGFECQGYSKVNPYAKQPSNPKGPQPLQAKNGYPEHVPAMHHPPPQLRQVAPPDFNRPPPRYLPPAIPPPHDVRPNRPLSMDEGVAHAHRATLPNPRDSISRNAAPYTAAPHGPAPQHWTPESARRPSYPGPDHMIRPEFARGPPQEFPRDHHNKQPSSPPRYLPPPHSQPPPPPPPPAQNNPSHYNPRLTATLALQHTPLQSPPQPHPALQTPLVYRTEKDKMLNSMPYLEKDLQLVKERHDCKSALFRFNRDAVDPNISEPQKMATFKQLIEPEHLKTPDHHPNPPPIGRVGAGVDVGSNFCCEYGYNILIGDEVDIGNNVTIFDSARVSIGARCTIAPGVQIITKDLDLKTNRRPGEKRRPYALAVTIEDDVFIGAGSIILPGVKIGKGAVIGAGTTVRKDVKQHSLAYSDRTLRIPKAFYPQPS